jgi:hypothetical protein
VSREQVEQIIARVKADIRGEKKASKRKPSEADLLLPMHLAELDVFVKKEVRVCEERKWRFDFAERVIPIGRPRLAFEIEGGIWVQGRHSRGAGYQSDLDKYNTALVAGNWAVFRFSTNDVLSGKAKAFVKVWLDARQAKGRRT